MGEPRTRQQPAFIGTVPAPAAPTPVFVATGNNNDNEFFVVRAKLNYKFGTY